MYTVPDRPEHRRRAEKTAAMIEAGFRKRCLAPAATNRTRRRREALRRCAAGLQPPWLGASRQMGELAAEFVEAANQSSYDRDELLEVAKTIVARTDSRTAAELSWAILSVIAQAQARNPAVAAGGLETNAGLALLESEMLAMLALRARPTAADIRFEAGQCLLETTHLMLQATGHGCRSNNAVRVLGNGHQQVARTRFRQARHWGDPPFPGGRSYWPHPS
jgi:hypothetical protein